MQKQTIPLTEMTQRVDRTAPTLESPSLNPGTNGGVTHPPSADIANFAYVARKTHCGKSLTIESVAVPFDILHNRKERWVATIIGSVATTRIVGNSAFVKQK